MCFFLSVSVCTRAMHVCCVRVSHILKSVFIDDSILHRNFIAIESVLNIYSWCCFVLIGCRQLVFFSMSLLLICFVCVKKVLRFFHWRWDVQWQLDQLHIKFACSLSANQTSNRTKHTTEFADCIHIHIHGRGTQTERESMCVSANERPMTNHLQMCK